MLFDIIRNGFSVATLVQLVARAFVVFCILPVHEFAHAYAAYKLGDDTARLKGRLTLNPMAHLNLWGSLMIFICGFGYATPVPVNPRRFKNPKAGMAITALAGPLSNLVMAIMFAAFSELSAVAFDKSGVMLLGILKLFFYYAGYVNVCLAIFNLIPIPPLDGSRILTVILPTEAYFKIMQYERYIMIGLIVLLFTGVLTWPLNIAVNLTYGGITNLMTAIFSFAR